MFIVTNHETTSYHSFLDAALDVDARYPIVAAGWKLTARGPSQYLTLHKSPNESADVILPSHATLIFSQQVMALITSGTVAANIVYKGFCRCSRYIYFILE